jgi:hypothetical protein
MILETQCVDLAPALDGERRQLVLVEPSDTLKDLTPILQRAIKRGGDPYFQITDVRQEGRKLSSGQRVDTFGFLGGPLVWNFNMPIKVITRMHDPDGNTRQRVVWVRQIEQGGIVDVQVDPNDKQGIKWLHANHFVEACDYVVCYEGEAVTADKLQSLANAARQHSVKVDICASNS